MSSPDEVLQTVQKTLGPYVRAREEAAHIRRVLALHLESSVKDASTVGPLALVTPSKPCPTAASRGLQREYLDALNTNSKAQKEYRGYLSGNIPATGTTAAGGQNLDHVHEHLATVGLQKKQEKLQAIEKHLELLKQKPAASSAFLDPDDIFRNSRPLPDVPTDVVTALALDDAPTTSHLKDLVDQMEKHVLRTKLLLNREEQLLDQVKSRSSISPRSITDSAKLEALNASRGELIQWIETELAKAGDGAGMDEDEQGHAHDSGTDAAHLDGQLAGIREKYAQYLHARKTLLQLVSQQPKPVIKPRVEETRQPPTSDVALPPTNHLLSPYLEQLLSLAHEQKGLIAQKSHFSVTLAKQLKDNCQALDRLADESQLIPAHPLPGTSRRKPTAFGDALSNSETLDSSSRVKPWVFAADSAKIATFETVAEKIEEGQIALEGSMQTIGEIDQLLGPQPNAGVSGGGNVEGDSVEDDIWMAESRPSGKAAGVKKQVPRKRAQSRVSNGVWDTLDGNLGLLRSDGDPP